jgi:hypothetical protein
MSFSGDKLLGVRFDAEQVQTAAQIASDGLLHDLGTRVQTADGKEYVFIQANGALAAADLVTFVATYDLDKVASGEYIFGVVNVAIADNGAGWIQTKGAVASAGVVDSLASGSEVASVADANLDFAAIDNDSTTDGLGSIRGITTSTVTTGKASVYLL